MPPGTTGMTEQTKLKFIANDYTIFDFDQKVYFNNYNVAAHKMLFKATV